MSKSNLKALFSGFYDLQKMRIQAGNRIVANFKLRLGQPTSKPESELDKDAQEILKRVRATYPLMADASADLPRISKFEGNEVISEYAELVLADIYERLIKQEERDIKSINQIVHAEPLWKKYLKGVSGVGELMALVILALIDIRIAKYSSSLCKYAGLDVGPDGKGRSRSAEHLEEREYLNKDGELCKKMGITFNPILKAKLIGVLGPSFLKAKNPKYAPMYYDYRNRLENHSVYKDGGTAPTVGKNGKKLPSAKMHRHNMAIRYIVKMFLIDLYVAWRTLEGLEVSKPYHEEKLGIVHSQDPLGNHTLKASQDAKETQAIGVSQGRRETHISEASPHESVNQASLASQRSSENHQDQASQYDEENHARLASRISPENH